MALVYFVDGRDWNSNVPCPLQPVLFQRFEESVVSLPDLDTAELDEPFLQAHRRAMPVGGGLK